MERRHDHRREGLTGLLGFDAARKSAEWGRHILRPDSLAAAESALLLFRLAFEHFELDEVWGTILAGNKRMIAYAESCGLKRRRTLQIPVAGEPRDALELVLTRARWLATQGSLDELARMAGSLSDAKRRALEERC